LLIEELEYVASNSPPRESNIKQFAMLKLSTSLSLFITDKQKRQKLWNMGCLGLNECMKRAKGYWNGTLGD